MLSNRLCALILPAAIFLFVPASSISQSSVRRQDLGTPLDATRLQAEHRRALGEEIEKLFRDDQAEGPDNLMPDPQRQAWFDYPLQDVLRLLEDDHLYDVESVAHKGDCVEDMTAVRYCGQKPYL